MTALMRFSVDRCARLKIKLCRRSFWLAQFLLAVACFFRASAVDSDNSSLVDVSPSMSIRSIPKDEFGRAELLSAFRLSSKDERFGGLSGFDRIGLTADLCDSDKDIWSRPKWSVMKMML
jgi:hypothetical protein